MSLDIDLARRNMVDNQVRTWDVLDPRVLDALAAVPREDFVPARYRSLAFADLMLPLGHGEVMLKPAVEGRILQTLQLTPGDSVLEVGTGSGFLTACLSRLARSVASIDCHADFADAATRRLRRIGASNVRIETGDAMATFDPGVRHDAVVIGGAVAMLPDRFASWVRPGGRLFAIVGRPPAMQAVLHRRLDESQWHRETLFETALPYLRNAAPQPRFAL